MQAPTQRLKASFGRLLRPALAQVKALDEASTTDLPRAHILGAHLWQAIDRLERFVVLLNVQTMALPAGHTWDVTWQRWLADQLNLLRDRAKPLLERVLPEGVIKAQRFATRLSALDPLAPFRTGPDGIVDVAGKLITGPAPRNTRQYRHQGKITGVSLRDANLFAASLSAVKLLDLDAQGAYLDGAVATAARLEHVNLTRASMRAVELEVAIASDCDFTNAELVDARWHGGAAIRCSFAGADLMNLSADHTMFMHCDFQGADLTIADLDANVIMRHVQFINCDLRWSRWHNRRLDSVCFNHCKLHGVKGTVNCNGVVIDRPDMSPAGDGSKAGSLAGVLALWSTSARSPFASEKLYEKVS